VSADQSPGTRLCSFESGGAGRPGTLDVSRSTLAHPGEHLRMLPAVPHPPLRNAVVPTTGAARHARPGSGSQ